MAAPFDLVEFITASPLVKERADDYKRPYIYK